MMTVSRLNVAVIGAGLAGLSCGRQLQDAGCRVTIYEKARGPGGRMSTRRGDDWQCDHGAQYFTARDADFRAEVARWEAAGVASVWQPRVAVLGGVDSAGGPLKGGLMPKPSSESSASSASLEASVHTAEPCAAVERFVGMPRMSAPAAWLASSLQVHSGVTINDMRHDPSGWRLFSKEQGELDGRYDAVVLAIPAPQAAALLEPLLPLTAMQANAVTMLPCWTLMLRLPAPCTPGYDAAFVNAGPLSWIARDSAKPGRGGSEVWVLQASPEWSAEHIEADQATVTRQLLAAFAELGGPEVPAQSYAEQVSVHRWLYAKAAAPSAAQCVWLPAVQVGLCGDWLSGGKLEDAWLSGRALATQVLGLAMPRQASRRA